MPWHSPSFISINKKHCVSTCPPKPSQNLVLDDFPLSVKSQISGDNSGFCVSPQWEMVKLQTILWNSCDNRRWHTCSTEEDTVFPWPWNGCDNAHGTTVTSSVVRLWQKRMIPLRQQFHHNLKTFYILVVKISSSFSMLFRFFVVQTYNKYFKYARKTAKNDGILS